LKKWDGKEVWLDPYVLDELYNPKELLHEAKLSVPFKGKGGKITHWNAIYVDPSHSNSAKEPAVQQTNLQYSRARLKVLANASSNNIKGSSLQIVVLLQSHL